MSRDFGIDLGTANVLIHLKGQGMILNEPAMVVVDTKHHEIVEVGLEAYKMLGRTSNQHEVVAPLKRGVIADYQLAEGMLILLMQKVYRPSWFFRPNILISTPNSINKIERTALVEAVSKATGGRVYVEDEIKVAALGAGVDIYSPNGHMVIDIGGGTTDIGIISSGEVVHGSTLPIAGDNFTQAIIQYIRTTYKVLVGTQTAQEIKHQISSAVHQAENELEYFEINGRDLKSGLPKALTLDSNDINRALKRELIKIVREIQRIMDHARPELLTDISQSGIVLTGGSALIRDLDKYISDYLNINVIRSEYPLTSVATGTSLMIDLIQTGKIKRYDLNWYQKAQLKLNRLRSRIIN